MLMTLEYALASSNQLDPICVFRFASETGNTSCGALHHDVLFPPTPRPCRLADATPALRPARRARLPNELEHLHQVVRHRQRSSRGVGMGLHAPLHGIDGPRLGALPDAAGARQSAEATTRGLRRAPPMSDRDG